MKIARFSHEGSDSWGLVDIDAETVQAVRGEISDWGPAAAEGRDEFERLGDAVPLADVRLLPPITVGSTIVGVGMNYWSHLEKLGITERPEKTQGFLKPRTAMIGHGDELAYPAITEQLDYEVELVAIMASPVTEAGPALSEHILGYTVGNDVSARDTPSPLGGMDLFTMKALNKATPLGPWIATKDEFGGSGPIDVEISLRVNGEERQRDRTGKMIWDIDECVKYVAERMDLDAGDVLFTGTTNGVAFEDGRWLQPGDVVEAEVEGVGVLRNTVGPRA
jgi:2-keto-4-pentenoate hydratase/2-oxohepta-3-ene-1,7-dioic acid hydratase in catechol pathway